MATFILSRCSSSSSSLSPRCLWFLWKAAPPHSHQDKSPLVSAKKTTNMADVAVQPDGRSGGIVVMKRENTHTHDGDKCCMAPEHSAERKKFLTHGCKRRLGCCAFTQLHAPCRRVFFFFPLQEPHVSLWLTCCRLILFCWCINCNVMFMCSLPDWGWLAGLQFRPLQLPGSLLRRSRLRLHPSWRHYGQVQHRAEGRRGYVLTDLITSTQKQFVNVQLQPRAFYSSCSFESFISISQDSHRTHVFFCHGQYKGVWQGWIWLMTINTSFFLQNHMIENRLYRI